LTTGFDRRQFLAGSTNALVATLLPNLLPVTASAAEPQAAPAPLDRAEAQGSAAPPTGPRVPPAPPARIEVVHDTYFGETLSDPYRWMENDKDPDWLPFLKAQNDRTRAVLDALPSRASLLKRIQRLSGDTVSTSEVQRAGGLTFFAQRPLGADNYKLCVRAAGRNRVLIDTTQARGMAGHVSLDWWRASPDGRHVVYGLSKDGSENSTLHVLGVADGKDLPERIADTQAANPQWLDDGSGFFYNQLTGAVGTPERFLDSQARFHRLGSDPTSDPVLMKRGLVAGINYDKIQSPNIVCFHGSAHALLMLSDVRPEARMFIAPLADTLAGRAHWTPVCGFEDEVTDVALDGDDLYLLVNKNSPRGRLVKTSAAAPRLAEAAEVVPQQRTVLESISRARDGMYLLILDGGISRLHKLEPDGRISRLHKPELDGGISRLRKLEPDDGTSNLRKLEPDNGISNLRKLQHPGRVADAALANVADIALPYVADTPLPYVVDIALPFDGTIGAVYADPTENGVLISFTGWLEPPAIYRVDSAGRLADTGITPKPAIDVSAYETQRLFASAKDGTEIPYTLIYRKGLKLDGRAPAWISAYGSYGVAAYTPWFAGRTLALVDAGVIVGYAGVRGGGEYGREWHEAGQLANKPNTWRDLIAVCEQLCARKYTSPQHLAIGGRSAGGIAVGRALTERPDLFAAVVDGVGWSNPLRYVAEQNGYGEEPEWGAITDPKGFSALKSIDSYQAVKDGTPYPAVLLTTGLTDPRVAPFHVAKMTARLQAATSSHRPILMRVDYDAGHGMGSTRSQQDNEAADTYAFLLWQLRG
jgi:prolyl oligopeptidase